jgi:capsular polysaccharide export protein
MGKQRVHLPEDKVLAWGRRPSAIRAGEYARRHALGIMHIEDGFLRSVGLGTSDPPLSIVLDDRGLYLDAARASRLESLIARPLDGAQRARARALITAWRCGKVSKYNHSRDTAPDIARGGILVVDQTLGDASIACGNAGAESFSTMLDSALTRHPDSRIVLKVHPDVISGRRRGHFDLQHLRGMRRVHVMDYDAHPATLLEHIDAVYTVTSQLGFEALIWGKPVYTFGMPFYAGWGLTRDALPAPARRGAATADIEQLVHAALIDYPRYVDPETGQPCQVEQVLSWLALQRRMSQRFSARVQAVGFSRWKRPYVREFFRGSHVEFTRSARGKGDATMAVWGRGNHLRLSARFPNQRIVCMEDGFIRSVGLGAELVRPLSWVQDDVGIYYDAAYPSLLEHTLQHARHSPETLARAAALRRTLCEAGITKYNVALASAWHRPPREKQALLVLGQVETDASIQYGASAIRQNVSLLQRVRASRPDAWLAYKPHPDVLAGLRDSGRGEAQARQWCDEIIGSVPLDAMLDDIDEVHVLTSLGGFEALLRGKRVVTHGQPFYAGWGLTEDRALTESVRKRRTRRLTLDELVAAVLIEYPVYVSRVTRRFTTPERAVQELIEWRAASCERTRWRRWLARLFHKS